MPSALAMKIAARIATHRPSAATLSPRPGARSQAALDELIAAGYVKVGRELCGPTCEVTGNQCATLTEAGMLALQEDK